MKRTKRVRQFQCVRISIAHAEEIAKAEGFNIPSYKAMKEQVSFGNNFYGQFLTKTGAKLYTRLENSKRRCTLYSYHYAGDDVNCYFA